MIDAINKFVGFVANPLSIGMLMVAVGLVLVLFRKRKAVLWTLGVSFIWFWFCSMPFVGSWLALTLE